MEVIVKKDTRINPRDAKSHPEHKRAVAIGRERMNHMKFKSEGERRDYMKQVASNPNNVPGLPAFYPPQSIRASIGMEHDCKTSGHRWSNTQDKFCLHCDIDKP